MAFESIILIVQITITITIKNTKSKYKWGSYFILFPYQKLSKKAEG